MLMSRMRARVVGADQLGDALVGDVLVVLAHRRLGCGREDGLRQRAGVLQARGQRHAADRPGLLVLQPATAGEVAAHHRFHRNRLQAFDQHRAAAHLRDVGGAHHALRRFAGEVVGAEAAEPVEPEQRHAREQFALAGNRLAHDDVERREPVAGDHQDAVVADRVVVAHLAAGQQRQRGEGCGVQRSVGHDEGKKWVRTEGARGSGREQDFRRRRKGGVRGRFGNRCCRRWFRRGIGRILRGWCGWRRSRRLPGQLRIFHRRGRGGWHGKWRLVGQGRHLRQRLAQHG